MIPGQNNKSSLLLSLNFICKCDHTASPQIEKLHSTLLKPLLYCFKSNIHVMSTPKNKKQLRVFTD